MPKKKAHYEFLPIYERPIFYGSDLKAIRKLVLEYYKESEIELDVIDDYITGDCHIPFGLAAQLHDADVEDKIHAWVMFIKDDADMGVITHECVHITNQIFYIRRTNA